MFHFENAYRIPVSEVYGYVCKTNLPSNTAFRGFGGPQGMFMAENMIRHIADHLQMDVAKVMFHIVRQYTGEENVPTYEVTRERETNPINCISNCVMHYLVIESVHRRNNRKDRVF